MRKKILLILTLIISFVLYTNNVEAAGECANDTDKLIDGYCCPEGYTSKVSTKDKKAICLDSKYSESELNEFKIVGGTLYKIGEATIQGTNNPCDNKKYFNCNRTSYSGGQSTWSYQMKVGVSPSKRCYTCSSSGEFVWNVQEPTNSCPNSNWSIRKDIKEEGNCKCSYGFSCSSRSDCESKDNWLKKCEYRAIGGESKIYIYFNNCLMKIYKDDTDVTEKSGNASGWIENNITIGQLLNIYNTDGTCPNYIYENHITRNFALGGTATDIHYSLTKDGDPQTYIIQKNNNNGSYIGTGEYNSCEDLFDEQTLELINTVMKWIRIAVPILLIGLGILDFTKATFSKSEEDMKKSREKFIKRIVAAVLVFIAPIFINLILELANSVWSWISPDTCIK